MNDIKNISTLSLDTLLSGLGPAVLKSIRDPFTIISSDYKIIWMNKGMASIYAKVADEVISKICYKTFFDRDEPCDDCTTRHVKETGRTYIVERWKDFPDGNRRYGEVRCYPVRGDDKEIAAYIIIVIDITDKKK